MTPGIPKWSTAKPVRYITHRPIGRVYQARVVPTDWSKKYKPPS